MNLADLTVTVAPQGLAIGVVLARGCKDPASIDDLVKAAVARAPDLNGQEAEKKAARDMLRHGKYKPTGRGKPASEYLLQSALEGQFPRVSPLVDLCNVVSLDNLLPISLIDLDRAAVKAFSVRHGRAGESYVFNSGGQTIDLCDLLLTARMPADEACANAVKDSMATKLAPGAQNVLAVIYAPLSRKDASEDAAQMLAELYRTRTHAEVSHGVIA
jgi:DNA/RNA-binding domain of Phe-tRNA-synthetase-like protein